MLESVDVGKRAVADYEATAGPEVVERLRALAESLRGMRILHLTYEGGVAEILRSEVPLLRDYGIAADWKIITGTRVSSRLRRRCTTPFRAIGVR